MGNVRSDACGSCHQDIAAEWRESLHHGAWTDPLFVEAYTLERQGFCRRCHAPESDPRNEPSAAAKNEGIGCTTCHVLDGVVLGVRGQGRLGPHDTVARPWMAGPDACAGCHQFAFPGYSHQTDPAPMQDTLGEWRRSNKAGVPCQVCHMPYVRSPSGKNHRSHRFQVQGDPAMLARAVSASAVRESKRGIRIDLRSTGVGHAFPTGDLFRRLEVRVRLVDASGRILAEAAPQRLERVYRDVPLPDGTFARVQVRDDRLGPPGTPESSRTLHFVVPASSHARIFWEVAYQRVATGIEREIHDEHIVARGELE